MSTTTRNLGLAAAVVVVAVGGFLLLRPQDDEPAGSPAATTMSHTHMSTGTTTGATATTMTTAMSDMPAATRIALKDGQVVGGMKKIEVSKGDRVRLVVASDAAGAVHVHGYDLVRQAGPGAPARFDFTADIDGRLEVEAHATDTQIAELTVNP